MTIHSGTSNYVVSNMDYMSDIQEVPRMVVELANGAISKSKNMGSVLDDTEDWRILLTRVYYMSNIRLNLQSCFKLDKTVKAPR